ncbi:MAG: 50S ribosomal protein L11 methyltransferase [Candidatus Thorarchaeota archaeon]
MTDREYATPFTMLHAASLLGQRSRIEKFRQAIQNLVNEGIYVVDIGTGSGVLAILAAKAGAGRVTAIEVNPESLQYAKEAAQMNGVDHLIEFVKGNFSDFKPKEKADIVICEMLSSIMLVEQQIPASVHATRSILKPDGKILPQEVTVYVVPVECPEIWERFQFGDLKFPRVVQTATPDATKDLADMQALATFDLSNLELDNSVDEVLSFTMVDNGTIHGLVGVFEAKLYEDIKLEMNDGWKQLFIPLIQPIEFSVGDEFSIRISYQPGKYDSLHVEVV